VCGWCDVNFDLTNVYTLGNLCGQSQVWIAFKFHSDSSITDEGSYLDDIILRKRVGVGNPPDITSINPNTASAGTDTSVTINGTNFGATQGSSTVKFWRVGSTWLDATIASWSDTQIVCEVPGGASSHTSSAVKVTTSAGSDTHGFTVTFSYGGVKWPGTCPMVDYEIYENTADCTGEGAAIQAAANTWNAVNCSCFAFNYAGATTRSAPSRDNHNVLRWGSTGGSIATAYIWYSGSDILECDVVFEDAYTWNTDPTCPTGEMDVQNIATHELGHWLLLLDLYGGPDSDKTMYGYGATCETKKRTLHSDDIAGICWIYPCITPSAPSLYSPSNGSSTCDNTPTFDWGSVSGAQSYSIQVDNDSDFSSPEIDAITYNTYYIPTTSLSTGTYYWRVRGSNDCGTSGWSSAWNFTIIETPSSPSLSSPSNGSSTYDTTPYFDWSSVSGATSYCIQVDNDSSFSSPEIDTMTSNSYYTPVTPLSPGTYYWRVRASNSCGDSSWSSVWSVNILCRIYLPIILRNASSQ
jgi:hypothetical protein